MFHIKILTFSILFLDTGVECHTWPGQLLRCDRRSGGTGHGTRDPETHEPKWGRPWPTDPVPDLWGTAIILLISCETETKGNLKLSRWQKSKNRIDFILKINYILLIWTLNVQVIRWTVRMSFIVWKLKLRET